MKRLLAALLTSAALASCASITEPEVAAEAARAALPETPDFWSDAQERLGAVEIGWIDRIGDPRLKAFVAEAQANNNNLEAAAAGVDQARALAAQAGAALSPSATLTGQAGRRGAVEGSASGANQIGLRVDWEVDLWGRIRAGQQAALFSAEAAEADYVAAQNALAAAVAQAYFLAIEAGDQVAVSQKSLETLEEIDRITRVRFDNGAASAQDVAITASDLASAQSRQRAAEAAQRDALRALEVLMGRFPAADAEIPDALPSTPPPPPAGLPSELLARRPDLVAAEREVAAAFNSLDQAEAARLPTISLTADLGGSSTDLGELLNPANLAWTLASNLVAPLIDGGLRAAQVDQASAEQRAAIATYAQEALDAFAEVEGALDQNAVLALRAVDQREAAARANEALRLARIRYDEGETDLLDVLSIQQTVFTAESDLVAIERERLDEWIGLNLALGGGWDDDAGRLLSLGKKEAKTRS